MGELSLLILSKIALAFMVLSVLLGIYFSFRSMIIMSKIVVKRRAGFSSLIYLLFDRSEDAEKPRSEYLGYRIKVFWCIILFFVSMVLHLLFEAST